MKNRRIIPCLDIKDGRAVKGVNFESLKDTGDPLELAAHYMDDGADELVMLDISATLERRKNFTKLVQEITSKVGLPITVGGGISSLEDVEKVLEVGASKVSLGSAAVLQPELITTLSNKFGKETVVVAIDAKKIEESYFVYIKGGTEKTEWKVFDWAKNVEELGAGEVLLTSMHLDGTQAGFDIELLDLISSAIEIPVIASGGAGKIADFVELFLKTKVTGGLAASVFHYNQISIKDLKKELIKNQILVK